MALLKDADIREWMVGKGEQWRAGQFENIQNSRSPCKGAEVKPSTSMELQVSGKSCVVPITLFPSLALPCSVLRHPGQEQVKAKRIQSKPHPVFLWTRLGALDRKPL